MSTAIQPDSKIYVERLYDDRLWVIRFADTPNRAAVDQFVALVDEYVGSRPDMGRYLVYCADNTATFMLTPYLRHKAYELARKDPQGIGRLAIVVNSPGGVNLLLKQLVAYLSHRIQPGLAMRIFGDETEAITWVAEALP